MHPILFEIFGFSVASYGLSMVLGAAAAWFLSNALARCRTAGMDDARSVLIFRENVWMSFLICVCGGIAGAFLFRPVTRIPEVLMNWEAFSAVPIGVVMGYLFGEIVFYGGFIGGIAALLIFCKAYKINAAPIADIFAPSIALAHAFGRIGCFLGGCCYGIETSSSHPFAVRYPPQTAGGAQSGVPILATQLIEAACLLFIATVLVIIYLKTMKQQKENQKGAPVPDGAVACLYALMYSIARFVLEYYRGDLVRGVYGPFSTSQYVSIALFCAGAVILYLLMRKRRAIITGH